MHHAAGTDEDFRSSLASEREPTFCIGCHAPRARSEGVGCLDCHRASKDGRVATVACEGCHQFDFPRSNEKMQATADEHAASPRADASCASCHMPNGSHALAHGSRDIAALSRALEVRARRTSPTSLSVTLRALGIGHDFPTGDLFRRLRVWVWAEGARGEVVADEERLLARTFVDEHGARRQSEDTRVPPSGEKTIDFDLGAPSRGRPIEVRVYYERVAERRGAFESTFASDIIGSATIAEEP